jgi:hypothetical protein
MDHERLCALDNERKIASKLIRALCQIAQGAFFLSSEAG